VSSLEDLRSLADEFFAAAGKPELADVLTESTSQSFRDFAGIEPTRPLGWYLAWPRGSQPGAQFVALPVAEREALVLTITGDDVEYRWEGDDLAVIDRPEVPYHAWFQDDIAWLGDDPQALQAVARRQRAALQPRPDTPLLTIHIDMRQIPADVRQKWQAEWRQSLSTYLQKRNDESDANYRWRRYWGDQALELVDALGTAVQELQWTLALSGEVPQLTLHLSLRCEADAPVARQLSRWAVQSTEWAGMADLPHAIAAGGLRWDGSQQALPAGSASQAKRSEIGWAVFGLSLESRILLVGLSGHARDWFEELLPKLGKNSVPTTAAERVNVGPEHLWWRRWLHVPATAWISRQGDQRLWLAFGAEDAASELLWSAAQEFRTWPAVEPATPVKLRVSSTWLASLVTGERIFPKAAAETPLDMLTLQVVPARRPGELRFEVTAPLSAARHLGQPLISAWTSELEQQLQPLE